MARVTLIFGLVACAFLAGAGYRLWTIRNLNAQWHPYAAPSDWERHFGDVRQGSVAEHTFVVTNKSRRTLDIGQVRASCTCAATGETGRQLRPGESFDVHVRLDTSRWIGPVAGACEVIFTNAPTEPLVLQVRANVFSPTARFSHDRVYFPELVRGTSAQRIITITNEDAHTAKWRITGLRTSSPLVRADYRRDDRKIICGVSAQAPLGPLRERICVDVQTPTGPSDIEIPVWADIVEPLRARPERLYLGVVAPSQVSRCEIDIPVVEATLRPLVPAVRVSHDKTNPGKLVLDIPAPDTPGFFTGDIRFATDSRTQPFVRVRYGGLVAN